MTRGLPVVQRRELPPEVQEHLGKLASVGAPKSTGVFKAGEVVYVTNGYELQLGVLDAVVEGLPGLAIVGATAASVGTWFSLEGQDGQLMVTAAVAPVAALIAAAAIYWARSRSKRAMARFDLGTFLLPEHLVVVSHGRYIVVPRSEASALVVDKVGTSNRLEVLSIKTHKGALQRLTGVSQNPEGKAALEAWLAQ